MMKLIPILILLASCGKPITETKSPQSSMEALRENVSEREILGIKMFMNFDYLPLEGDVKNRQRFWSSDSWRLINGSINLRWNSPQKEGRFYRSPMPADLRRMSQKDLEQLSPSEKYDLLQGRYDYPLKNEVERNLPVHIEPWEGLCHGWAGASLNYPEPTPKTFTNPEGIRIPFGSADIKALLTYYYSSELIQDYEQVGKRCEQMGFLGDDFCDDDVTPVDFHLILTNKLGLRGDSFIMDIDRYKEVWNHPILSYESKIIHRKRIPMGRIIQLQTSLRYVDVVENESWTPTNGTYRQIISKLQLEYELTLDNGGNIVEGKWLSRARPDFIWTINKVQRFNGYLADLKRLTSD